MVCKLYLVDYTHISICNWFVKCVLCTFGLLTLHLHHFDQQVSPERDVSKWNHFAKQLIQLIQSLKSLVSFIIHESIS